MTVLRRVHPSHGVNEREKRSTALPPRPVVRCALRCLYCAHVFARDFSVADNFAGVFMVVLPRVVFPRPIANVEVTRMMTRRTWYGRTFSDSVSVREPVKCPRCGSNCTLVSREPVAA